MSPRRGPAYEEQAELAILRDQADRSAAAAARTLAELNRRLTRASRARAKARGLAAGARVTAARVLREGPGTTDGQRGAAWRAALAVLPVILAAGALVYWRKRHGAFR